MKQNFTYDKDTDKLVCGSVDVVVFGDDYPSGHQSGITLIMHDRRMTNGGDVRFEPTPGQWQPVPVRKDRTFDEETGTATAHMHYPDEKAHLRGFNPLIYPDVELDYRVNAVPFGNGVKITVSADTPVPSSLAGKACFNMEIVPCHVIGGSWIMDEETGIFPAQPDGPVLEMPALLDTAGVYDKGSGKADIDRLAGDRTYYSPIAADDRIALPYAEGHHFTVLPESELYSFSVTSVDVTIKLYDGRMNHNNGWFVISSELPTEKTGELLTWYLEPRVCESYRYIPVIQTSQVGYHPMQKKTAVIELDGRDDIDAEAELFRVTHKGMKKVRSARPEMWGKFLRYNYARFDFSDISEKGLYQLRYKDSFSSVFRIDSGVYERGVWQPVLEYFLPVQMCHMEVREKYRIWHGHCHSDDAVMAPTDYNHFDGYYQGSDTLCGYKPGEHVPGLDKGGWHDAGDYDLRIESQSGEVYNLVLAFEEFGINYDSTTIDQDKHLVEIHRPDGKNDILEQIEHGLLSIVGGYESLGRLYRGIICRDLRQYVLLGDASDMTDGRESSDDRWVFTENNPFHELSAAAHLAAAHRAMKGYNDIMADKCLNIAKELYRITDAGKCLPVKIHAAVELLISTGEDEYRKFILDNTDIICESFGHIGWIAARAIDIMNSEDFTEKLRRAAAAENEKLSEECSKNPYGLPYRPGPWGSGWGIQAFGSHYHFLHKAFPDICPEKYMTNSLDFILGCHPGSNRASYASGVGAVSATTAYGANRADHSYIPGGVISGTELINPDFPELLDFPFLWQQGEYVLGGGSSHYMFLVLAVKALYDNK